MKEASQPADIMLVRIEMSRTAARAQKELPATSQFEATRRVLCTRVREIQRFQSLPQSVTQLARRVLCTRVREIQRFQSLRQSVTQLAAKCDPAFRKVSPSFPQSVTQVSAKCH